MTKPFHYTVKGHWPFPLDMLRYDQSEPASVSEQAKINFYSTEHAFSKTSFEDVEINLVGPNRPNTARWESFGWTVPTDTDYALTKQARRREAEDQQVFDAAMSKLSPREREIVASRIVSRGHA